MSEWKKIPNLDMHCFACGPENHSGLQMEFESNGEALRSFLVIPEHLRGWSNLAHGGVISTILDETMGWTAIFLFKRFILTQDMTVKFHKPVYIGEKLSSHGMIKETLSERKAILYAEIRNEKDEVCASSEGRFVLFKPEEFKKLNLISDDLFESMSAGIS